MRSALMRCLLGPSLSVLRCPVQCGSRPIRRGSQSQSQRRQTKETTRRRLGKLHRVRHGARYIAFGLRARFPKGTFSRRAFFLTRKGSCEPFIRRANERRQAEHSTPVNQVSGLSAATSDSTFALGPICDAAGQLARNAVRLPLHASLRVLELQQHAKE